MIDKDRWNICKWKKHAVDEEFYRDVFLKIPSEGKEAVAKEAKWSGDKEADIRKDVVVNHGTIEPERRPYGP